MARRDAQITLDVCGCRKQIYGLVIISSIILGKEEKCLKLRGFVQRSGI